LQFGLGIFISSMIIDQLLGLKRSWEKYFMKEAQLEIDAATGRQAIQIAHDLRSPIESIKVGLLNMKASQKFDDLSIELGLKRIYEICNSLLSKTDADLQYNSIPDINAAVTEVIHELQSTNPDVIQISLSCCETLSSSNLVFSFDLSMLKRTICNLVKNSIEASNATGKIWVKTYLEDTFLKISVQDEGAGFQVDVETMLERGFTTKSHGNGLGLSGAKQFVESLGGMITLNRLEKGSLVNLMIPASIPFKNEEMKTSNELVLIDDDPLVRFNWKRQGQKQNITVSTFDTVDDFITKKDQFPCQTPIYIDSNLGSERGELLSKKIFELGFKDITLTTGAPKSTIRETKWITNIVGKCFEAAVLENKF
jgi:hypothetical protein